MRRRGVRLIAINDGVDSDDEEFKNPVDLMFDALEAEKPNHFAVRQYKSTSWMRKPPGDICSK